LDLALAWLRELRVQLLYGPLGRDPEGVNAVLPLTRQIRRASRFLSNNGYDRWDEAAPPPTDA
jgi:hypothetical protein